MMEVAGAAAMDNPPAMVALEVEVGPPREQFSSVPMEAQAASVRAVIHNAGSCLWAAKSSGNIPEGYACVIYPKFCPFLMDTIEKMFVRYNPIGLSVDGLTPHAGYCAHCCGV